MACQRTAREEARHELAHFRAISHAVGPMVDASAGRRTSTYQKQLQRAALGQTASKGGKAPIKTVGNLVAAILGQGVKVQHGD